MGIMIQFPAEYRLTGQNVRKIVWYSTLSEGEENPDSDLKEQKSIDCRWVDFSLTLKNGDTYHFTAVTPNFISEVMETEHMKSWLEPGCIIVRETNHECIFDAVE